MKWLDRLLNHPPKVQWNCHFCNFETWQEPVLRGHLNVLHNPPPIDERGFFKTKQVSASPANG